MTTIRNAAALSLLALLLASTAGCGPVRRPFPQKDYFAVETGAPPGPADRQVDAACRVRRLRVSAPYGKRSFVYRVGSLEYETDYYNGFIASPDELLTGQLAQWLAGSKSFSATLDSAGEASHRYVLEGVVTELHGDYRNADSPRAVLCAKFFLLDDELPETRVVFQESYREEVGLKDRTPQALAAGFGDAFRKILTGLTADIAKAKLLPGAGRAAAKAQP